MNITYIFYSEYEYETNILNISEYDYRAMYSSSYGTVQILLLRQST